LPKQTVFITDADSDSGKALIAKFSGSGANLLLNSLRDSSDWEHELNALKSNGTRAFVAGANLCSSQELSAMLDAAESEIGTIDVMIHNQSVSRQASVESCKEAMFFEIMQSNAKSAFFCTQAAGKRMAARGSGSIIYVSSIHSEKPTGSAFLYSASQGAVKMLAHEAALFLGRQGVRVNVIEMGPVEGTGARFTSGISGLYDNYQYKVPSGSLGTYEDLAELAYFLSQDEARYVNGADIRLDGGFVMHYMDFRMKKPAIGEEPTP